MSYFIARKSAKTTVDVMEELMPVVYISTGALNKMQTYVDECLDEIGWLGTVVEHQPRVYLIEDVYLFDQEVHGATTEITPEGLSSFAEEILQQSEGIEIWNNLKMWGHSHVNMGVSPSSQDNKQMETFQETGHDWFIRLIANKKGELKLDFYDYKNGVIFTDVRWNEYMDADEFQVYNQIKQLEEQLELLKEQKVKTIKEPIKEEMKLKVRKKTYPVATGYTGHSGGYYQNGKWTKHDEKKTTSTTNHTIGTGIIEEGALDFFRNDDEVIDARMGLTNSELETISYSIDLGEVNEYLEFVYGHLFEEFTMNDVERVYRVALKKFPKEVE
jgi:hypothetical protein